MLFLEAVLVTLLSRLCVDPLLRVSESQLLGLLKVIANPERYKLNWIGSVTFLPDGRLRVKCVGIEWKGRAID